MSNKISSFQKLFRLTYLTNVSIELYFKFKSKHFEFRKLKSSSHFYNLFFYSVRRGSGQVHLGSGTFRWGWSDFENESDVRKKAVHFLNFEPIFKVAPINTRSELYMLLLFSLVIFVIYGLDLLQGHEMWFRWPWDVLIFTSSHSLNCFRTSTQVNRFPQVI